MNVSVIGHPYSLGMKTSTLKHTVVKRHEIIDHKHELKNIYMFAQKRKINKKIRYQYDNTKPT